MATAANSILPVVAAVLGATFAYSCKAYRARIGGAYVVVRRLSPASTVAEIAIDADSRSEERRIASDIGAALRSAGFDPHVDTSSVRVDWTSAKVAA